MTVAAAQTARASRILAQSVAWQLAGEAGAEHERSVLAAGGIVLRYGKLDGPGTYFEHEAPTSPRIHVDEAARARLRFSTHLPACSRSPKTNEERG